MREHSSRVLCRFLLRNVCDGAGGGLEPTRPQGHKIFSKPSRLNDLSFIADTECLLQLVADLDFGVLASIGSRRKIGFANEIARLSKYLEEDGLRVMDVVCKDTNLNISRYYLRPGAPFGGSCLPKDVSALRAFARQHGINLPPLENTQATNEAHQQQFVQLIENCGKKRVGFIGLAFKSDTYDLRGSPLVAAAGGLIGRGYTASIYDAHIDLSHLIGSDEQQIQNHIPRFAELLRQNPQGVIEDSNMLTVPQKCVCVSVFQEFVHQHQTVVDMNGWEILKRLKCRYIGLCR